MGDPLAPLPFRTLTVQPYVDEFDALHAEQNLSTLKLETAQHFIEPGNESWDHFARGDWTGALDIIHASASDLRGYYVGLEARGVATRRTRIVSLPLTPYLQWECHALKARYDAGEDIRVCSEADVRGAFEFELREYLFLGLELLYDIQYDEHGRLAGAHCYEPSDVTRQLFQQLDGLHASSSDFGTFFSESVAPLGPPNIKL